MNGSLASWKSEHGFVRLTFRNGVAIDKPVRYALAFLENDYSYRSYDVLSIARDSTITLDDIRAANRIGARMSAQESEALFARRDKFEHRESLRPRGRPGRIGSDRCRGVASQRAAHTRRDRTQLRN